jgi:5'-3' exonuclease
MTLAIIDGDVLLYMSVWGSDTLEEGKSKFNTTFTDITNSLFTKDYVMAMGGPDNYRIDLYSEYKRSASRVKSKSNKPDWFDDLKSWTVEFYDGCIITDNCEADDMVRIWAVEAKKANIQHCVVTIDKDLDCIPGTHYNPRTKQIYQIDKEWADYFYWKQLLMGDSVDNIPGIYGIGPKKAEGILKGAKNKKERIKRICREYHDAYGEEGFNSMLLNGKLLHIWRHINDHFTIDKEVYEDAIKV